MLDWMLLPLRKYATFSGRARRSEYWYFALFIFLCLIALSVLDGILGTSSRRDGTGLLSGLFMLGILLPSLAVTTRRLHDIGRSGWWQLLNLLPFIGFIVLLVMLVKDSQPGDNAWGPSPKAG